MKICCFILLFIISTHVAAQKSGVVKGKVTFSNTPNVLPRCAVSILNAKDSILKKTGWADGFGLFELRVNIAGNYILFISSEGYMDKYINFRVDSNVTVTDVGITIMDKTPKLLDEVVVKGKTFGMKLVGDTIEYKASAFLVQKNATVEDLLRQFPGLKVDRNGNITSQGQSIKKVLVDGEEFFSDDPTFVTKNLRAEMVEKVQLYDKNSESDALMGTNLDGKVKTIDVKLRSDKRNGDFGKFVGGVANNDHYQIQGMVNKFSTKRKMASYGTFSNTQTIGLGQDDNSMINSSISTNLEDLDFYTGKYNGSGLPSVKSGGAHYDQKISDNQSLNTNYKIGSILVTGSTQSTIQQTQTDGTLNFQNDERFRDNAFRQKFDLSYQVSLDPTFFFKVYIDGQIRDFQRINELATTTTINNNALLNEAVSNYSNQGKQTAAGLSTLLSKRFKKIGRSFLWRSSFSQNNLKTTGELQSNVRSPDSIGNINSDIETRQNKSFRNNSFGFDGSVAWAEPISKELSVVLAYQILIDNKISERKTSVWPGINIDGDLSNDFELDHRLNSGSITLAHKHKKEQFKFTTKLSGLTYDQGNKDNKTQKRRIFSFFNSQANFQYNFTNYNSVIFNYNTSIVSPTIDQLQPVTINIDPLNLKRGNESLEPYVKNNIAVNYNLIRLQNAQSIYLGIDYLFISSPIVNDLYTDSTGINKLSYRNLSGRNAVNYSIYGSWNLQVKPLQCNLELAINSTMADGYSYVNNILNKSRSSFYSSTVSIHKEKKDKYIISASFRPSFTKYTFSLQPSISNNALGSTTNGNFLLYLSNYQIGSDIEYIHNSKTQLLKSQNRLFWNANFGRSFLENRLKLSIIANDIMNQNLNIYRNINANTITQSRNTGIGRYLMLSISWNYSNFHVTK